MVGVAAPDPPAPDPSAGRTLLTVGHGRLPGQRLAGLLAEAGVDVLVDVRRQPFSRRNPQFGRDRLAATLQDAGIAYEWWEILGGRRAAQEDSPNRGVRDEQLRGYADHLATEAARQAVAELVRRSAAQHMAVACAEGDWRRCHRQLLADALAVGHGVAVRHLDHEGIAHAHEPHPSARVDRGVVVWDRGVDQALPGV